VSDDHDKTCKIAARAIDAPGFLRWVLPARHIAGYDFERWLPTETLAMPGEPERRCDTVAGFQHAAGLQPPLAYVVEFMTTPRTGTLPRLAEYCLRVHREVPVQRDPRVPYRVLCAVVYLTGAEQANTFAMEPDEAGDDVGLWLSVHRITMAKEDAVATVAAVAADTVTRAALPFVPLMRGANDPELVKRWRQVTCTDSELQQQATIGFLALTLAKLMPWVEVWNGGLANMGVEKSPYWEEIRVGGRVEGRVEQARQSVIDLLQDRFGNEVAAELTPRVVQTTDLAVLNRCMRLIVPGRLEELRTLLGGTK
jgi:hypothetical protein